MEKQKQRAPQCHVKIIISPQKFLEMNFVQIRMPCIHGRVAIFRLLLLHDLFKDVALYGDVEDGAVGGRNHYE